MGRVQTAAEMPAVVSTSWAYRWPVGMPLCRALGDGLWEVRTSLPSKRIARVSFSVQQVRILVLQGFIKKTQQTAGRSGPWAPQKP